MNQPVSKPKKSGINLQTLLALFMTGYGTSPIDVIPDFIPVVGALDDTAVIVVCITLIVLATIADRGGNNNNVG